MALSLHIFTVCHCKKPICPNINLIYIVTDGLLIVYLSPVPQQLLLEVGAKIKSEVVMADHSNDCSAEKGTEDSQGAIAGECKIPQTNHGQTQRLVITHIVNEFFKSYAGKQVLGPFHKVSCSI